MTNSDQPSIAALVEQLRDLRALIDALRALRSDFDAAKLEGAEQVDALGYSIGAAREYTEMLDQLRMNDIARLDRSVRDLDDGLARLRSDIERRFDDVRRTAGRW